MLTLRFPEPVFETETEMLTGRTLFDLPPQVVPAVTQSGYSLLQRLRQELEQQAGTLTSVVCHPHRVGFHQYITLYLTGTCGSIDCLITITGETSLSVRGSCWRIDAADSADAWYLILWLTQEYKK